MPGEIFEFDVLNFDPSIPMFEHFQEAFQELCRTGLGPGRPKVELIGAERHPEVKIPLVVSAEKANHLQIAFLTAMELKSAGETFREPRFDILLSRARDRVSSLASLYQDETPAFDFAGLATRAQLVRMVKSDLHQQEVERRSSRTGLRYAMGGFLGTAEYEGDLGEFLPILKAAEWTGVGRMTVWGNGRICLLP